MCCTHQGDIPCGAWRGIAEADSFFPDFPFPKGACYFWCFVYPRQNKIYLFEVVAVLLVEAGAGVMLARGSGDCFQSLLLSSCQMWHFGQQMWLRVSSADN